MYTHNEYAYDMQNAHIVKGSLEVLTSDYTESWR